VTAWNADPLVVAGAAVAGMLYARGFVRLRRRGRPDLASPGRAALFAAGLAAVVLPLVSPLDALGDRSLLSAHMLEHVLVGDAGPALLVLAVRGPLLLGQLLCGVLFLSPSPLYAAYTAPVPRPLGLVPLHDQQYAGLVMMAEQLLTLGTFVALLGLSALRFTLPPRAEIRAS